MRRDLVKRTIVGSNSSEMKEVKEGNTTVASKGQQEERNPCIKGAARGAQKKKDISRVKCFRCGELGHYSNQCPLKKRGKEEKQDQQVASTKIDRLSSRLEEEFAMITDISPGGRWGDLVLLLVTPKSYKWAGSLRNPPLGSIPCYGSP